MTVTPTVHENGSNNITLMSLCCILTYSSIKSYWTEWNNHLIRLNVNPKYFIHTYSYLRQTFQAFERQNI